MGGKRCTLVNRDRSLTSAFKNGRLYLTNRLGKEKISNPSSSKGAYQVVLPNNSSISKPGTSRSGSNASTKSFDSYAPKRASFSEGTSASFGFKHNKKYHHRESLIKDEDVFDMLRRFFESNEKNDTNEPKSRNSSKESRNSNSDDMEVEEFASKSSRRKSLKKSNSIKKKKNEVKVEDITENCLDKMFGNADTDSKESTGSVEVKPKKKFPPVVFLDRSCERHNSEPHTFTNSAEAPSGSLGNIFDSPKEKRKMSLQKKRMMFQRSMSEHAEDAFNKKTSPKRRLTPSPLAFQSNDSDENSDSKSPKQNRLKVKKGTMSYLDHDKLKPSVFDKLHDQVFSGV